MGERWFYLPPDIEGWHEEGFEIRATGVAGDPGGVPPLVCRDCRDEKTARLIAAAPDLLEAAREVRDVLRDDDRVFLADRLQQAIEKATEGGDH